jgi:pimeloyl-ACP methyl ester carboxylesterase
MGGAGRVLLGYGWHRAAYITRNAGEQAMPAGTEIARETTGRLDRGDGVELAWAALAGRGPTVVFLPGFRSDMGGDKATALAAYCAASGQAMLRLDYSGHGASAGAFTDGTIGIWTDDALAVIAAHAGGRLVLVGSSMGGWIALLAARVLGPRLAGLIGIAAAPDFTETLMWQAMTFEERAGLMRDGVLDVPSEYGGPYPITRALIEDGRGRLLLDGPIALDCPVRLLQGQVDPDVPWETALRIAERVTGADVRVVLVKDGDHRLSRPADLALLRATLAGLLAEIGAEIGGEDGA